MTGGKNPWGGDDGVQTDEAPRLPAPTDTAAEADVRPGVKPHNPWLTPDDDSPLRRSARIDDILRPNAARRSSLLSAQLAAVNWLPWAMSGVAAASLAFGSVHVLDENQRGVVSTLGRHTRDLGPGLSVTLPWPIETVERFDVGTIQLLALPAKEAETLMPTRDGQLIDIAFQVRWKITDPSAFAFNLADPQAAINDLADAEMRATIAEMPFDPVWDGKRRKEVTERARQRMQAALNAWHAGVTIEAVEITRANPPGQLAETFLKVTNAEGEAGKASRTAEDWAARTINNAHAEAQDFDRIYQQYRAAPEITRKRMYYETMERVIGNSDRVIVGGTGEASPLVKTAAPTPASPEPQPAPEGQ